MVKQDFIIPGRKKIGCDLLKLNYQNCQKMNRAQLLASAPLFGLSFLGDGREESPNSNFARRHELESDRW